MIIEVINLKKYYGSGESMVKALDGINLKIEQNKFLIIVGTSGSGKSTLLHMLGGLDYPTSGKILINGVDISKYSDDELSWYRRGSVGFIFQDYNLIPMLNVYENIVFPVEIDGKSINNDLFNAVVNILKINEKLYAYPSQLSGGQQQRVAIARALISSPAIILADEPTGSLDSKNSQEVLDLLRDCGKQFNQTIIMITHNEQLKQYADETIRIEDGKIIEFSNCTLS